MFSFSQMHSLLHRLLEKRNIKNVSELQDEEKATYETWQKILSQDPLTVDNIKKFCEDQVALIEKRWSDMSLDQNKKAELIAYHTVYKALIQSFQAPQVERENLEKYLNQLIQK